MSESRELSLSDLCTICRINEPKYKCPRCATPTCSLPCSKRHKLWSQCSGVRDPAAYLKRKELATPVAFDKDFNFLSGIERYVERAERSVENRGIELCRAADNGDGDGDAENGRRQRWKKQTEGVKKGEVGFLRGIESAGVKVVRAPKGMSRGKQNMSHWHKKHKSLNWTVEWILCDDAKSQKAISKSLESTSVATAFSRTSLSKQIAAEISTPSPPTKKRKLDPKIIPTSIPSTTQTANAETRGAMLRGETPVSRTLSPEPESTANLTQNPDGNGEKYEKLGNGTNTTAVSIANGDGILDPPRGKVPSLHKKHHFYLHRPLSRSRVPVLIPLTESLTITDALRNRTVLEFPTFYVLPWAAGELPADRFVTEEVYLRENGDGGNGDVLDGAEEDEEEGVEGAEEKEGNDVLQSVDEKKVLEVLCKDLEVGG
ncbi:conserved hypothetical protein [Histoplasma capsulatum G186AR]|uniref:Box C/D snoRNA protein 1 n=2 Tax=Ajellomyces capsulatus TaxID=5037 RepID=C0NPK7_AJECG|nr:uncharacterized protein HCBG_05087 [Histoplasma capsulatum G186AR]EEH06867.1 conserved hypothetical protein [Histoplasma capsulatum G186AR]KAG5294108.1 HIT finger domain-containing protein [Histoplasma capsulatum]QSS75561.1 HIT finger domain-containing protein [Histoplasma capsulatum G186AR]